MTILAVLVALLLSGISAYFSVLGLTAIFPASFWQIVVMGSALELAKIVTVVWLHRHWSQVGTFIRAYLCIAVVLLMGLTSMGVFGFLSKAHIEYQVKVDVGVGQDLKLIDQQILSKQAEVNDLSSRLDALAKPTEKMVELSKTSKEVRRAIQSDTKRKDELQKEKDTKTKELLDLQKQQIKLQGELSIQEAEVGPIKYLANLFYGDANRDQLERAVRWAIIVLVVVFDPLAISLLLGASSLGRISENPGKPVAQRTRMRQSKKGYVEIKETDLAKF